ncbi:MAG: hypothetical protein JWQ02_70 [Capsulimonas sp.]|nr:hypothetical protein [Capsulimonas sp.]
MARCNPRRLLTVLLIGAGLSLYAGTVARAAAEVSQDQQDRVAAIGARVFAAVKDHPAEYTWPPIVKLTVEAGEDNAGALLDGKDEATGKTISYMYVSPSLLKDIIKDNDDALAFIMGHEIGHVLLHHVTANPERDKTGFLTSTFTRQQEYDADALGMKLAMAGGFSFRSALLGPREFIRQGLEYSSFEGSGFDHPSWKDRIAALDKEQQDLWRSMSAFDNGKYFLTTEQYDSAARCFEQVTRNFPKCEEAWSNLGYARLMQYCDGLNTSEIRKMGMGQIVVGGFYQRPKSLEAQIRDKNPKYWEAAVVALKQALVLKPNLTLGKANLALAYLVSPNGKYLREASTLFKQAAELAANDTTLDTYTKAVVMVNAGVTEIAMGQPENGRIQIDRGAKIMTALASPERTASSTLNDAVLYNRALLLAKSAAPSDQTEAIAEISKYLQSASPASAWWPIAYDRYTTLCKSSGATAKTESDFQAASNLQLRPLDSLEVTPGNVLIVSSPIASAVTMLGDATPIPLVPDTNLELWSYPKYGVEVIGTDIVLGIRLSGPNAPVLNVRGSGLGAPSTALHIGMTKDELQSSVKEDYEFTQIVDPDKDYRFYRNLGLAVLIRGGKVQEMVIVQIPRKSHN